MTRRSRQPVEREYVAIYADESCLGNGRDGENPGGAAGVVEWLSPRTKKIRRFDYWISEPATTNNRMALRSVIEAFTGISKKSRSFNVLFTTDSRYIVDGMTSWVAGWEARGWRRKGGAVENLELWKQAVAAVGAHDVQWQWVRGHTGHPQNEYANDLATAAAAAQSSSKGLIPSKFDAWLNSRMAGKKTTGAVAPFPGESTFKPSRRYG